MSYLYNTAEDQQAMLDAIGAASIDELFSVIPEQLRLPGPLQLPPALDEIGLTRRMTSLADQNRHTGQMVCFLGGGSYDHLVPAVVDAIASRSEFYTSYTPYQPEVSQGNLEATFEYQTLIARLTAMDASNASVYDGATAGAEAVLMAFRCQGRHDQVVLASSLHPEYRQTIATYLSNLETDVVTIDAPAGVVAVDALAQQISDKTACVVVQHPNFFGCLEDVRAIADCVHSAGALLIVTVDPISLGLLERPGDYGADIVVAEGQPLGTPLSFGGPYLGIMASRRELVRRMPGRIVGETVDRKGRRCYVLTMQTREQHIRREKATSNICTNQGLFALRAAVYLSQMGPLGMREVAEACLKKSRYAADRLCEDERFSLAFPQQSTFKEFVVRDRDADVPQLLARAAEAGFLAGIPLARWYPERADCFLVAVTEKRSREEIDALVSQLHNSQATMSHA
ncbi:MAG: aminomethyl-transferring glycine dehydrogenase subunit GcvPA [Pirellulales bacterium]